MPNWKKVLVSGSDAALNSLNVTTSLTASGLIYPTTDGVSDQVLKTDGNGNLFFEYTDDTTISIKNVSGGTITKGTPCYITASGTSGNVAGVVPADAGNPALMPAGVIAGITLNNGDEGPGLLNGFINGVDTSAFASGDQVYVSVGGGYTNVAPTGSALVQKLGNVEKVDASNGSGVINGPNATRSVPNINPGYLWVGNSDWVATATATSSIQNVVSSSFASTVGSISSNITNNTDNRVLTATGGGSINGEANLTFNGSTLTVTGNVSATALTGSLNIPNGSTLGIGTQTFYPQGSDGFSVNENFNVGNSTQTAYHFTSGNSARPSVVFSLARTSNFTNMFGVTGSAADNKFVFGAEFGNTDFEWRKSLGVTPVQLQGGTLLARLTRNGNFYALGGFTGSLQGNADTATSATTASYVNTLNQNVTITGSLAVTSSVSINNSTYSNQTNTVNAETKTIISIFSAGAVHMDYYVTDGSSARAGTFVGTWDGGSSREFYETATNDIGDTTDVVFTVTLPGGQLDIDCTTTTSGWTVVTNTRTLTV